MTRASPNGFAGHGPGAVIQFPPIGRFPFHDAGWREQHFRECAARVEALRAAPRRTRPRLVCGQSAADWHFLNVVLPDIRAALREEG